MAVRVSFEIGHEASIRTKRTPEGFTHDWEVFVRGVDTANIGHFVDKVVFLLHDTFPKPKRVVKEPPYSVKESGYAGFNLVIEIYLKNKDEPKKIKFHYDLHLQQSGPPIVKVQKEKFVFQSPGDDFRKKLLKGGGLIMSNVNPFMQHINTEHERDSRDSYTDEKPPQLIGKPKLSGDNIKKHRSKEYRLDDTPRPTNSFENLFGPTIHKTSKISPDPKKSSPNPKTDKKDKDKSFEKDKQKGRTEIKEKEHKDEKFKYGKDEKDRAKEEKRSKAHKDNDRTKDKSMKRLSERPPSPSSEPPLKRSPKRLPSPKRSLSPFVKSNGSISNKEELRQRKTEVPDVKKNKIDSEDTAKAEKKSKKDKKNHDKDKSKDSKREHRKDAELKVNVSDSKEAKVKDAIKVKEIMPVKEKERTPVKPEKPFNKFSIENMLKEPLDTISKSSDHSKHRNRSPSERKHKHKKKDKKHDESKEKHKEEKHREKKHKHDKHKDKTIEIKETVVLEKTESPVMDKSIFSKASKEKERSITVISPISIDGSSQSNSRSSTKISSKFSKDPLLTMIDTLSASSNSEADMSISDDDVSNIVLKPTQRSLDNLKLDIVKTSHVTQMENPIKTEKQVEKVEKHKEKSAKKRDKESSTEAKDGKKQRKRRMSKKDSPEVTTKQSKLSEENDLTKSSRADSSNGSHLSDTSLRVKSETKSQDSSLSSGAGDDLQVKCESPDSEDTSQETTDLRDMTPDYMMQLKDLQHRIQSIQSNDELERVVNLIAETGKYEVTKKTFDFDLCLLDRSTVQQLQELIGCESKA